MTLEGMTPEAMTPEAMTLEAMTLDPRLRLGFIGAGNMARSLIGGLLAAGHPASNLIAADPDPGQRAAAAALGGIATSADNGAVAAGADVIVLAIKPQVMGVVCRALQQQLRPGALLISIAAGIRLDAIERWLGPVPVVRCMPNTPALLRAGITALTGNAFTGADQLAIAAAVLGAVGKTAVLDSETQLDAVTAISGSGPAYFFLFTEALIEAGIRLGLAPDLARALAVETAHGAARMALDTAGTLAQLRGSVTSPNGTTEAAVAAFEAGGLRTLVDRAATAARDRSIALADELGTD